MTETRRSLVIPQESAQILDFIDKQLKIFWLPDEIAVEKDVQDILVNFTESEKHGVLTTLKLFSIYEDFAGEEYWGGKFKEHFKDNIALTRMASAFSFFENCVHLPFYKKINELLHVDTDEFYNSYVQDPALMKRMDFIGEVVSSDNILYSLAAFSMIEGAVLYSSFAFLKHFQSRGKNKLLNIVRGINFSVRDENCLDSSTEVLTSHGWKNISKISLSDYVCQYNPQNGEVSYTNPTNIISTISDTSFIFEGEDFYQRVTPNHRMIGKDFEVFAKDAKDEESLVISASNKTGDDILTDEDKLSISLIISGELSVEWLYSKMRFISSEWAESAVNFYLSNS